MGSGTRRLRWWRMAAALTGGVFLFGGCDPATKAALEDGIINASTSLLTALMQAIIGLASEQNQQQAQVLIDSFARFCV